METKNQPTIPTVHLNGSGYAILSAQYREAIDKVSEAIAALPVPHGRDYYTQEDGAFQEARTQFKDQVLKLEAVRDELKAIARGILCQRHGRAS